MRRFFLLLMVVNIFTVLTVNAKKKQPNVIFVLTDDQGYGDISALGNPYIITPNLDILHEESVRFTDFHVDPTCSPTRSALLTGRYSHKVGVWHTVKGGNHLRSNEKTMAQYFKESGYATAHVGKWHLGGNYPYRPTDRGFDFSMSAGDGGTGIGGDYWFNDRVNDTYLVNNKLEKREGYETDVLFNEAMQYIDDRDTKKPFFMYLATYAPHGPLTLPDISMADPYRDSVPLDVAYFYAAIQNIDANIGMLREYLKAKGLDKNTIFIFATDNGTAKGGKVYRGNMRGGKGSEYDGGHRVPLFIHWPKGIKEHNRDVNQLTAHIDLLPTLIDLCNLNKPSVMNFDGVSLTKLIENPETDWNERYLFVERQRNNKPEKWARAAAMTNDWRLVNGTELYAIKNDPTQKKDVSLKHPEVVEKLSAEFDKYWEFVLPGSREEPIVIVGSDKQKVTLLNPADLAPEPKAGLVYQHGAVSKGKKATGHWTIKTELAGKYRFKVFRWSPETNAKIIGTPSVNKIVDSYYMDKGITTTLYEGAFKALPVKYVRFFVNNETMDKEVLKNDEYVEFIVDLKSETYIIKSEFIDAENKRLSDGYFVQIEKIN